MIDPLRDFDDPALFQTWFAGSSWNAWRAIIRASFALPMKAKDRRLFVELAGGRSPPKRRVDELWVCSGRRSGKDSIASFLASDIAVSGDFSEFLRPGEMCTVLCLASTKEQANIVLRYIRGYFDKVPMLQSMVTRQTVDGLELSNNVEIVVSPNSYRSVRGKTLVVAIFDEVAFWRDETSANPDVEVYNSVIPALSTIPGSMLIGISTPYRRSGLLYQKWAEHFGKSDDDVLVIQATSRQLNPLLDQHRIDAALRKDREAQSAEWLAQWRADLVDYVDRAILERLVVQERHELPPVSGKRYVGFADPSGGSVDSFTAAVAHSEGAVIVLDALREIHAPFDPSTAAIELSAFFKSYGLKRIGGDRYGGQWPAEQFEKNGLGYEPSERSKSEIYVEILPKLNTREIELLDNGRLIGQIAGLERRTRRGSGLDIVDHPAGQKDDCANAALGVLLRAATEVAPLIISDLTLARSRQPSSSSRYSDPRNIPMFV